MDNCIFCKIVAGELPSYKVYEDDKVLAFLDIKPVNPGHTLVVSKAHYQNLEVIPEDELIAITIVIKKLGKLLKDKLAIEGYNVCENNDSVADQEVPHLHFHVIPRHVGDGLRTWKHVDYQAGEAEDIIKKLQN